MSYNSEHRKEHELRHREASTRGTECSERAHSRNVHLAASRRQAHSDTCTTSRLSSDRDRDYARASVPRNSGSNRVIIIILMAVMRRRAGSRGRDRGERVWEREKERAAITHAECEETPPHVEGSRATDAPGRHVGQVGIRRRHLPPPAVARSARWSEEEARMRSGPVLERRAATLVAEPPPDARSPSSRCDVMRRVEVSAAKATYIPMQKI